MGSVTDNFDRADGSLGSDWTVAGDGGSSTPPVILSHEAVGNAPSSGESVAVWASNSFDNTQASSWVIGSQTLALNSWMGLFVRAQSVLQYYMLIYYRDGGGYHLWPFLKNGSGSYSAGTERDISALSTGDVLKYSVADNISTGHPELSAYLNGVLQFTDADTLNTYTSGVPGFSFFAGPSSGSIDNWQGDGAVVIPPPVTASDVDPNYTDALLHAKHDQATLLARHLRGARGWR